jgi:hypothetical protein
VDVAAAHAASLPETDDRWQPAPYPRDELLKATVEGGMAGVVSHPLDNVLRHIRRMCEGDPGFQFGLSGLQGFTPQEVLELVSEASGFVPQEGATEGAFEVEAERILDASAAVGERLAEACRRNERMILATGHPIGLMLLYTGVAEQLGRRGVELLTPGAGTWEEDDAPGHLRVEYLDDVAILTDGSKAKHTHSGEPMRRMLERARPDLVFADHGFAGAAIDTGIETVSIADVNDPALLVAKAQGRTEIVIVMDDNAVVGGRMRPDAYWPVFQEIVAKLP